MCCLFGLLDYNNCFTPKQRERILHVMAKECEVRGTDATGISYLSNHRMSVFKRAARGGFMRFHLPHDANIVMGHTRMTTQGNARHSYNNHPFAGSTASGAFSLAHNGVLWNDSQLRKQLSLPSTKIETDSYIAVQLLEQEDSISFRSLKNMAEAVEGQFTFTVLDHANNLYIVKGQNPMAIYHFAIGFYLYASTEEILQKILNQLGIAKFPHTAMEITDGQILRIDENGQRTFGSFEEKAYAYYNRYSFGYDNWWDRRRNHHSTPLTDLLTTANNLGYSIDDIV
ncbi:MAG: hypothetical protein RR461_12880, partial [Angelakisella sp.]